MSILSTIRKFILPIAIITVALFLKTMLLEIDRGSRLDTLLLLLLFCGAALLVSRSVDIFYIDGVLARKNREQIPTIFRGIVSASIWGASLTVWFLSTNEHPESFAGFLATSSVMLAIVGFAVRNLVADFFAGITLGMERPFSIGEWIEITEGQVGQVIGMNWRSTKIVTRENIVITIPNAQLSSVTFRNYDRPSKEFRVEFSIVLGYDIESMQAERILLAAANDVGYLRKAKREPEVKIKEFNERGVEWLIRFWIDDYAKKDATIYEVQKNLLQNLRFLNITPPPDLVSIKRATGKTFEQNEIILLLFGVEIFKDLQPSEIELLACNAKRRFFSAKQNIVKQGEGGDSLFIVAEGLLNVSVKDEEGISHEVAVLRAGMFFGEVSLLTGEARSATVGAIVDSVVFEIPKSALAEILEQNPSYLTKRLSSTLAKRQVANAKTMLKKEARTLEQVSVSYFDKIKLFFNLKLPKS